MFVKLHEDETKMFLMLFLRFGVDKNAVKIYHNELIEVFHENKVHDTRERRWCIGETKGHDSELVETVASGERCLWNILFSDLDLMVTHSQVQLGEYRGSSWLIK